MKNLLNSDIHTRRQKHWIILLLATSCMASALLLFTYTPADHYSVSKVEQVDSLITEVLHRFRIPESQVQQSTIRIDSSKSRIAYTVNLPYNISKTQWHYELDKVSKPYGIQTPAKVFLPEEDMRIYLVYGPNIVRTITLRTDHDLIPFRQPISLIVAFNRPPSQSAFNIIASLGEPVVIAVRSRQPRMDVEAIRNLRSDYSPVLWWLASGNEVELNIGDSMDWYIDQLSRLGQLDPDAQVLFFNSDNEDIPDTLRTILLNSDLSLIEATDVNYIEDLPGRSRLHTTGNSLTSRSSIGQRPILIIEGNDSNIRSLQEYITILKREQFLLNTPAVSRLQ